MDSGYFGPWSFSSGKRGTPLAEKSPSPLTSLSTLAPPLSSATTWTRNASIGGAGTSPSRRLTSMANMIACYHLSELFFHEIRIKHNEIMLDHKPNESESSIPSFFDELCTRSERTQSLKSQLEWLPFGLGHVGSDP